MPASDIVVKGAREHNLQDVDLVLPRNQLICLTGVSGSGKSSLAFDTLYAEGQRRYVESLSSFARHFLGQMPKPDVDLIAGLSPSISISQKSTGNNPRSTVGTITEIYDYLRVLYARVGQGFCTQCNQPITAQTQDAIIARILNLPPKTKYNILAPIIRGQKGEHRDLFEDLVKQGFMRARVDGEIVALNRELGLDRTRRHTVEIVVDRLVAKPDMRGRVADSVELALKLGKGNLIVAIEEESSTSKASELPVAPGPAGDGEVDEDTQDDSAATTKRKKGARRSKSAAASGLDQVFSLEYSCGNCGISFDPPTPQMFSFNSPQGMCETCDGLGELYTFDRDLLVPDPRKSFRDGAVEIIGDWKEIGRWRRHIYSGVAETYERLHELPEGTLLDTPWKDLPEKLQDVWLYGTGDLHITYTWRGGSSPMKYGGEYTGIVEDLDGRYRGAKSAAKIRQLESYMSNILCPDCKGQRLGVQGRHIKIETAADDFSKKPLLTLPELCQLSIDQAADFFSDVRLDPTRAIIAEEALKEIRNRLGFLLNVGLNYLTLNRSAPTLSGGESQRIRLAGQIGSGLVGVLYILDEPSIGLHPRDNDRLLSTLEHLRDMGNTVLVVEHDEDTMWAADHIVDFGPGPGVRGGRIVAEGTPEQVIKSRESVTGAYLSRKLKIETPQKHELRTDQYLEILGAAQNNLRGVDIRIPLGNFVCITGVSGSGKSSLVNGILVEALRRDLNRGLGEPGKHTAIQGINFLDKMIAIDQSPIGRTPRSNPGTYIKVFDDIRNLFAQLPEAKMRGYKPGRFSFNVKSGRCEACEGNGSNKLEMDFLADVWVTCPVCEGHRFKRETLQVLFKGKSIADVLELDIADAMELFENVPKIYDKLKTLHEVGLDYLKIGQPSPTLSGGEAQRIKLARELVKRSTGQTLYLLDEPTTGLHFADVQMLLNVLHNFVAAGNTVLVVEHNLDVIKTADWIIDLGPEGGDGGGNIVAEGRPREIAACKESYTGIALSKAFAEETGKSHERLAKNKGGLNGRATLATKITVTGASQHNLKGVDVEIARDKMTVFCGPSGSGKSSLAMDTIYAEGQRRYVESLSSYARQFVNQMQKPKVDHIDGLSPAIAIEQKNLGNTPRSTVGTVTEVYDYLRILMSRLGTPYCPDCDRKIGTQTSDEIVDKILAHDEGTQLYLLAPVEPDSNSGYEELLEELKSNGFGRVRIDSQTMRIEEVPALDRKRRHQIEVVVDRIKVSAGARSRIADSVEASLSLGRGLMLSALYQEDVPEEHWQIRRHSQHLACDQCGRGFERLSPNNFSFNSQLGWCQDCEGLGTQIGANPALLIKDPALTLAEGALNVWPTAGQKLGTLMLQALAHGTNLPLDVPYEALTSRQRRILLHGTRDRWFEVREDDSAAAKKRPPLFRFQYKGIYPSLDEASRLSNVFRQKLERFTDEVECTSCDGSRLRADASAFRFRDLTIDDLSRLPLSEFQRIVKTWKLDKRERNIAGELIKEIQNRVDFLNDVGLRYISLSRTSGSLSNGEAQRIRLASQLGSGLCGVLYVLDEPTIGLHPRDNTRLLAALHRLRDLGNTLLVVEHDQEVIANSDFLCDFGPQAGRNGGEIVAHGTPAEVMKRRGSVTGPYLSGKKAIPIPTNRRPGLESSLDEPQPKKKKQTKKATKATAAPSKTKTKPIAERISVLGARHRNLKEIDVHFPLGTLTVVTGPSGCGKSSLVNEVLYNSLARRLHRAATIPGAHRKITGIEHINKVIRVDQQPLGNSPTSNPATYTGVFELIRTLFAQLPESKVRGFSARRFSFNVPGGRCENCLGNGEICIEMHFLPDVWVRCQECDGHRYNEETLAVQYHGQSISDVLNLSCAQAVQLFKNIPKIRKVLETLCDVGLDYVTLGQSAPTLSGGEAQRVKLAAELARPDTGRTLYLLDEPTTGLHFDDLVKLLDVLHRLVDLGNSVVLIEHNMDVIKSADWVIDMGPEAGADGGYVVAAGTPEQIVEHAKKYANARGAAKAKMLRSYTGEALAPFLERGTFAERKEFDPEAHAKKFDGDMDISSVGKNIKPPWEVDGERWHTQDRIGRKGEEIQWDGQILSRVVETIQNAGEFSETNWENQTIVEICGPTKSLGWFFHAITAETYLLKMKFRVKRNTFKAAELLQRIPLKTLNQLEGLPVYGNQKRVTCKNLAGPWQEVEIRAHSFEEIDTPEFWSFIQEAAESFLRRTGVNSQPNGEPFNVANHAPWKVLGRKWHLLRKGFPGQAKVAWEAELTEQLCDLLEKTISEGEFIWDNKQVVNLRIPEQSEPWAAIQTKKPESLVLHLRGPKGAVTYGEMVDLGARRRLNTTQRNHDVATIEFVTQSDLEKDSFITFLQNHFHAVANGVASS
jgi:excinuclease ABC subunit A